MDRLSIGPIFIGADMKNLEILAPAGNMEMLYSAVRSGANAVYLGIQTLNARRNAGNFSEETLPEAVKYCHQRRVKIYLTLNTLVSDTEMQSAYSAAENAMKCGIDGFIVQDLGLAEMIHSSFPEARLHASTQCSVNTPEGFRALQELGFCRAVIPREMSIDEIREVKKKTDIELEIFVHGALCMCVSGQCYLSAMLGGRSGNRGLCAQPCRLPFSADNSSSCDLSLKDLSLIKRINEIADAGVISLKIEGRMKRPEYVAAAVTACKKAIGGSYKADDEYSLRSVFSRSGFTDGYFTGRRQDMFGTRLKEDVVSAGEVLKELAHIYDNENPLIPVDFAFSCRAGKPISLFAKTDYKEISVQGAVPETAINKPMTVGVLEKRLSKLGGTQYYIRNMDIELDEGLIVSASEINGLRRSAVEKLNETDKSDFIQNPMQIQKSAEKSAVPYYTARFLDPDSIPDRHPFKRIFIPVWSSDEDFVDNRAGAEIPRGLFGCEERLKKRLAHLKKVGVKKVLCSNYGAYTLAGDMGFDVYGDFGLNVFNSNTAKLISSPILSFELTLEQANRINADDTGIVAYGRLPLMITRCCPIKNHVGCDKCGGVLTDRKGFNFPVKCSPYPCTEILNPVPLYLGDRMKEVKCDFVHFYFTDESKIQVENIISKFSNGEPLEDKYTRGLYYRGVL